MKKQLLRINFAVMLIFFSVRLSAQVVISLDTIPADHSAMLEIRSASKGILIPRLTYEQVQAIADPVDGLLVFCLTDHKFYTFSGAQNTWTDLIYGNDSIIYTPCPGVPEVYYNGKNYTTVLIGTQCWFRENLNTGTRINGDQDQANNSIHEKYCYNNLETNCDIYGGLYQWGEMVQYHNGATNTTSWSPVPTGNVQGICPGGWHIPTYSEYEQMVTLLGGWQVAGGKMKTTGSAHWMSPNTAATNSSGFSALPGGARQDDMNFYDLHGIGDFWTATEMGPGGGADVGVYATGADASGGGSGKKYGFSVRCVKDL